MTSTSETTDPQLLSQSHLSAQSHLGSVLSRSALAHHIQNDAGAGEQDEEDEDEEEEEEEEEGGEEEEEEEEVDEANRSRKMPRATLLQKIEALDWYHSSESKSQLHTVKHFNRVGKFSLTKSTLNRWILGEDRIRKDYESLNIGNAKIYKTKPRFKYPEINRCLEMYYDQSLNEGSHVTEKTLITKWASFYRNYHDAGDEVTSNMTAKTFGWLHHFKKRNQVRRNVAESYYKARDEMAIDSLEREKFRLRSELGSYALHQIYQFDEVSFKTDFPFFGMNSSMNDYSDDRLHSLSFTNPTKKITVGILANADGSSQFPPLVLTDEEVPQAQTAVPNLFWNKNGMMTPEIFYGYLKRLNQVLHEPVVILCDNLYSHFVPTDKLANIKLVYLTETLNKLKYSPLEYGVLRLFKVMVKDCILQLFLKKFLLGLNNPKDMTFTKVDLIGFIGDAWDQLQKNSNLIKQCFKNSGILPKPPSSDLDDNETKKSFMVKDNARESQLIGLLKIFNDKNFIRINYTIDSFIFPKDEVVSNVHMTEHDIIQLVKNELGENSNFFEVENDLQQKPIKNPFDDSMEVRELSSILLKKVKPFFDQSSNSESALQFSKFINSFIKETNSNFLKSFMNDTNIKEKIERKRKRDETISINNRFLEFENTQTNAHMQIPQQQHLQQQQPSYDFNGFRPNKVQRPQQQQLQPILQQQQQQQQSATQRPSQQDPRFMLQYPNFNLPVNHPQYGTNNPMISSTVSGVSSGSVEQNLNSVQQMRALAQQRPQHDRNGQPQTFQRD